MQPFLPGRIRRDGYCYSLMHCLSNFEGTVIVHPMTTVQCADYTPAIYLVTSDTLSLFVQWVEFSPATKHPQTHTVYSLIAFPNFHPVLLWGITWDTFHFSGRMHRDVRNVQIMIVNRHLCTLDKPMVAQLFLAVAEGCECWLFQMHIYWSYDESVFVCDPY